MHAVFLQGAAFPLEGKHVGQLIALSAITEHVAAGSSMEPVCKSLWLLTACKIISDTLLSYLLSDEQGKPTDSSPPMGYQFLPLGMTIPDKGGWKL